MEVHVGTIHDIEGAGLRHQNVEYVDVVDFARRHMNKGRDVAAQVQESMQFHCCLGATKGSPGEDGKAQVDGGGVECVNRVVELDAKTVVEIQPTSRLDQGLSQVGIDTPVTLFVGFRQSTARNPGSYPHVVKLLTLGTQTGFDVSQTFPVSQLGKGHAAILILTTEAFDTLVSAVPMDATTERVRRNMVDGLRKDQFAGVHEHLLQVESRWKRVLQTPGAVQVDDSRK